MSPAVAGFFAMLLVTILLRVLALEIKVNKLLEKLK